MNGNLRPFQPMFFLKLTFFSLLSLNFYCSSQYILDICMHEYIHKPVFFVKQAETSFTESISVKI